MKVKFFWFLKENNALGKFIWNVMAQNPRLGNATQVLNHLCRYYSDFLYGTFIWYKTPEGDKFWRDLDYRWEVIAAELIRANN